MRNRATIFKVSSTVLSANRASSCSTSVWMHIKRTAASIVTQVTKCVPLRICLSTPVAAFGARQRFPRQNSRLVAKLKPSMTWLLQEQESLLHQLTCHDKDSADRWETLFQRDSHRATSLPSLVASIATLNQSDSEL